MAIPDKIDYLIIGAGIHGLSTAWHLAKKLKAHIRLKQMTRLIYLILNLKIQ